ncbi:MAG: hypothetical protein J5943_12130 [Oribacterium sp.]|nr:hypothetical protein [Oribacterium sp.]MBO6310256.1 hypothetical protein [Oribacterium sp.]MBP3802380.1 hypothetical protein [Oribacterium sp.]
MNNGKKRYFVELQEYIDGFIPMEPTLKITDPLSFIHDYPGIHDQLPDWLEGQMFGVYYWDRFLEKVTANFKYKDVEQTRDVLNSKQLNEILKPIFDDSINISDYTFVSYTKTFPIPEQREATYSMIFVDGDRVAFAIDNTYKYEDWSELIDDMIGKNDRICGREGLHHAFVMYTDSSDSLPIWTFYEKTVAGFIVDHVRKQLTAFSPESAVLIYHLLYRLCSAQYSSFFGQSWRTGTKHIHDDSKYYLGDNPYIQTFRQKLEEFQENFDMNSIVRMYYGHIFD